MLTSVYLGLGVLKYILIFLLKLINLKLSALLYLIHIHIIKYTAKKYKDKKISLIIDKIIGSS